MDQIVDEQVAQRIAIGPAVIVVAATVALNLLVAAVLASVFDVSDEFQGLQAGPVVFATTLGMVGGVGVLAVMRRRWPRTADRRFTAIAIGLGLLSCVAPLSMLAADPDTVDGWSRAAVWSLVPLHLIPTAAAAALPQITRR